MIEIKQDIRFVVKHPIKDTEITVLLPNETIMDIWLPYLNKFEDMLIQERIKYIKNSSGASVKG